MIQANHYKKQSGGCCQCRICYTKGMLYLGICKLGGCTKEVVYLSLCMLGGYKNVVVVN